MRDTQPPITNDEELAGYRAGLERFNKIVAEREATLFASHDDAEQLEHARQELYRVYRKRQGILDAIAAYERLKHASKERNVLPLPASSARLFPAPQPACARRASGRRAMLQLKTGDFARRAGYARDMQPACAQCNAESLGARRKRRISPPAGVRSPR